MRVEQFVLSLITLSVLFDAPVYARGGGGGGGHGGGGNGYLLCANL